MIFGRKRIALLLGMALFLTQGIAIQAEEVVTPLRRAAILLRTLCYDQNLKTRVGKQATVVVLQKGSDATSVAEAGDMAAAFQKVIDTGAIGGFVFKVARVDYSDPVALESSLTRLGATVVYVCDGLDSNLEAIKRVTRQRKVLTMCGRDGPVRAGLSVGVYGSAGKGKMIVNLASSRAEGVAFQPELLRLAEIVN
jgi:hypothetical protein